MFYISEISKNKWNLVMGEEIKIESNMGTEDILQKYDGTKS